MCVLWCGESSTGSCVWTCVCFGVESSPRARVFEHVSQISPQVFCVFWSSWCTSALVTRHAVLTKGLGKLGSSDTVSVLTFGLVWGLINANFTLHTREIVKCDRRLSWCYGNEPWERQLPLSLVMPMCPEPTWWKESADSFLKVVLWPVCVHRSAHSHRSIYTQNNKRKLELCGNW